MENEDSAVAIEGSMWTHVLEASSDVMLHLSKLVFIHYPKCCEEGGVLESQRQLRDVVVSLHGCVLAILEAIARLLEGTEYGGELESRVRIVRDAVGSLPHPTENLPPPYEPAPVDSQ